MNLNFLAQLLGGASPAAGFSPAPPAPVQNAFGAAPPIPQPPAAPPMMPQQAVTGVPAPMPEAPQVNALQALNTGAPADAAIPAQAPPAAATPAPRERRSILDTVGRISDVLAKVGGADALYQPTLDQRQDRGFAIEDRARGIDMDKLKQSLTGLQIQEGQGQLSDAQNSRLGQAVRGLQAITAKNPQADISKIWPLLAEQAGVPVERAAAIGQAIAENPAIMAGLASTLGQAKEFGLQPFYYKDADGNLKAAQLGKDGSVQQIAVGDGATPIDPLKFVDTGGTMQGVGTRSGNTVRILPKTEAPGKVEDRASRENIAGRNNATQITIAGMPARGKAAEAAGNTAGMRKQAGELLDELDSIYTKLDNSGAAVNSDRGATGNVVARARSSGVGQLIEGFTGSKAQTLRDRVNSIRPSLMQSLAKATGMTGKQLDSNADVKLFMQTVTDPTKSVQANKQAIEGLRRFLAEQAATPAARPSGGSRSTPPAGRRNAGKPSVSNW